MSKLEIKKKDEEEKTQILLRFPKSRENELLLLAAHIGVSPSKTAVAIILEYLDKIKESEN